MEPTKYTCIKCRVYFEDQESQKQHYKSAWHCFNLNRVSRNLPPVTLASFEEKVEKFNEKRKEEEETIKTKVKKKRGKKKMKEVKEVVNLTVLANEYEKEAKRVRQEKEATLMAKVEEKRLEEEARKQMTEDEIIEERLKTSAPIPPHVCFFDNRDNGTVEANVAYMEGKYSFYIPEKEHLIDMEGLMEYLGQKIGLGYTCLWCDRVFKSAMAAQHHMSSKGHTMIRFYDYEEEFMDFYDWHTLEEADKSQALIPSDRLPTMEVLEGTQELILPSGHQVGHRSLLRYYKQHYRLTKGRELDRLGIKYIPRNTHQYSEMDHASYQKRQQYNVNLNIKANKLQTYFRAQMDC